MAKSRPADPPLSAKRDRRSKQPRGSRATRKGAAADDLRANLLDVVAAGAEESTVLDQDRHSNQNKNTKRTDANPVPATNIDDDDHVLRHARQPTPVAVPTPIGACIPRGKVITNDGRELPFYLDIPDYYFKPLPGFEHESAPAQGALTFSKTSSNTRGPSREGRRQSRSIEQFSQQRLESPSPVRGKAHSVSRRPVGRSNARQQSRKRMRSPAQQAHGRRGTESSDGFFNDEDEIVEKVNRGKTAPSHEFYIGNFKDLARFFQRRFEEFTTRPLRPIVTTWVKLLEPRRLGGYGPYHRQLPKERPIGETPPWWPQDVPYNEPSHLPKHALQALAVDLLLQHRDIDEVKRKVPWTAKLRETAEYAVKHTPPDSFCASKNPDYCEKMRKRALEEILPSIFDIAQTYEDYINQLREGCSDLGPGGLQTWSPLGRQPRHIKKIKIETSPALSESPLTTDDVLYQSGDETEVDDFASEAALRREQARARKAKAQKASSKGQSAGSPQQALTDAALTSGSRRAQTDMSAHLFQTPTNNSFDHCLDNLRLGESINVDADAKPTFPSDFQAHHMINTIGPMGSADQFQASQSLLSAHEFHSRGPVGPFNISYHPTFHNASATGMMASLPLFANVPYTQDVSSFMGTPLGSTADVTDYQSPYANSGFPHGSFNGLPTGPHENHEAKHFGL